MLTVYAGRARCSLYNVIISYWVALCDLFNNRNNGAVAFFKGCCSQLFKFFELARHIAKYMRKTPSFMIKGCYFKTGNHTQPLAFSEVDRAFYAGHCVMVGKGNEFKARLYGIFHNLIHRS